MWPPGTQMRPCTLCECPVWRTELRGAPSLTSADPGLRGVEGPSAVAASLGLRSPVHSTSESVSSSAWDDAGQQLLEK